MAGNGPPRRRQTGRLIQAAQEAAGYAATPRAKADALAILANWKKLDEFGCFTPAGIAEMKKGGSPTIKKGKHAGEEVALDHVLPVAVVTELRARYFNLEAMAAGVNGHKGARITAREVAIARQWHAAGLLSMEGLEAVEARAARVAK